MFNKYKDYNLFLDKIWFKLNFFDNEVPQGLCIIKNKIYITCYKIDNTNSIVIEYNRDGKRLRTIDLNNRSHVGGIGYDKKSNLVFICDTLGKVTSYHYNNFEKYKSYEVATIGSKKLLEKDKLVCSYLCCNDGKLYVGSFNLRKNGIVKVFSINKVKEDITLEYENEFLVPKRTQGLTFYKEYLILSISYGRRNNSSIRIVEYSKSKNDYRKENIKIIVPPMLEQIDIVDNELLLLFESSAYKYKNTCKYIIDDLVSMNIEVILNNYK